MKIKALKTSVLLTSLVAFAASTTATRATIVEWQNAVNTGTLPVTTLFTPVSGSAPQLIDVGALTDDRSFEFIVNAGFGGPSSALLGYRDSNGNQGLKFEQWMDSGLYGMTNFGVEDFYSDDAPLEFTDTHVVFVSQGSDTILYLNGTNVFTFADHPLVISGEQGIAAIYNSNTVFNDILDGTISGFASYDEALSPAEIQAHSTAFFSTVPEPSGAGLITAAMGGLGILLRRRQLS